MQAVKNTATPPWALPQSGPRCFRCLSLRRFVLFTLYFLQRRFNVIHPAPLVGGECSRTIKALQDGVRPGKVHFRLSPSACHLAQADGEIDLPQHIAGIPLCLQATYSETVTIGGEGRIDLARCRQYVADPLVADSQIALPVSITAIFQLERLFDGKAIAIHSQGIIQMALRHKCVADPVVADGEVTLPFRVSGILFGQSLSNG